MNTHEYIEDHLLTIPSESQKIVKILIDNNLKYFSMDSTLFKIHDEEVLDNVNALLIRTPSALMESEVFKHLMLQPVAVPIIHGYFQKFIVGNGVVSRCEITQCALEPKSHMAIPIDLNDSLYDNLKKIVGAYELQVQSYLLKHSLDIVNDSIGLFTEAETHEFSNGVTAYMRSSICGNIVHAPYITLGINSITDSMASVYFRSDTKILDWIENQ